MVIVGGGGGGGGGGIVKSLTGGVKICHSTEHEISNDHKN